MQSVPITTDVVSFEMPFRRGFLDTALCYEVCDVTCDRSVVFSRYSEFLHQYNWNIVESGVNPQ